MPSCAARQHPLAQLGGTRGCADQRGHCSHLAISTARWANRRTVPSTRDGDLQDLVQRADELMREEAEAKLSVDPREVAADLGIPANYVDRAEEERAHRKQRRRLFAALSFVLTAILLSVVFLAARNERQRQLAAATAAPLSHVHVLVDEHHGEVPRGCVDELGRAGARTTLWNGPITAHALRDVDVLILNHPRRTPFTREEIAVIRRYVREEGGGVVLAELGWSWAAYAKRPLDELPANMLGKELDVAFDDRPLDVPTRFEGKTDVSRGAWVASGIRFLGAQHHVALRDARGQPMVGSASVGKGKVAVFGHHGILDDNPNLVLWAIESTRPSR